MLRPQHSEDYYVKILLQRVTIKEIMTKPAISVNVEALFSEVEEKLRQHGIRHLPVVNDKNILVGLITQRDLYRIISPRVLIDGGWCYDKEMLNQIILKSVMRENPAVVHPEAPVGEAIAMMVRGKYGCLPVVKEKQELCGILTQTDLLKIAAEIYLEK